MIRWLKIAKRGLTAAEDVQVKGWYRSRTVWVNAVVLIGLALAQFGVMDVPWSEEQASEAALAILTLVNMALRVVTDRPVGPRTVRSKAEQTGSRNPKL